MTGSLWKLLLRACRSPSGRVGLIVLGLLALCIIVGPWLLPDPAGMPDLLAGATAPSAAHPMGTDQLNRDILARVLSGGRVSLAVSAL
ncbi:MAG TPA: hypothetical protein VFV65_03930, partial [Gemmatimonadales bacterium]|nr:hypothetical protein [Gemmatimonadales bacterium]